MVDILRAETPHSGESLGTAPPSLKMAGHTKGDEMKALVLNPTQAIWLAKDGDCIEARMDRDYPNRWEGEMIIDGIPSKFGHLTWECIDRLVRQLTFEKGEWS